MPVLSTQDFQKALRPLPIGKIKLKDLCALHGIGCVWRHAGATYRLVEVRADGHDELYQLNHYGSEEQAGLGNYGDFLGEACDENGKTAKEVARDSAISNTSHPE